MSAIAIFVKTPGLSTVKSRLALGVGEANALECHLRCARVVAAVAQSAGRGPVYWAIAEAEGIGYPAWSELPCLVQQGQGLGERMRSIHDELLDRHGSALLIGADLPQLQARLLCLADDHLNSESPRAAIGLARDGGFWLVGANHKLSPSVWNAPRYGGQDVARDFLKAAAAGPQWFQLPILSDLDHAHDVPRVIGELENLPERHPLQHELLQWLYQLNSTTQSSGGTSP